MRFSSFDPGFRLHIDRYIDMCTFPKFSLQLFCIPIEPFQYLLVDKILSRERLRLVQVKTCVSEKKEYSSFQSGGKSK